MIKIIHRKVFVTKYFIKNNVYYNYQYKKSENYTTLSIIFYNLSRHLKKNKESIKKLLGCTSHMWDIHLLYF